MNRYILSIITVSVLFIPVSFASAETITFHTNKGDDGGIPIYSFVQIVHRNSNGDLLAVLQSDKMTDINPRAVNYFIDKEMRDNNYEPQIIQTGGQFMQLYSEIFTNNVDRVDMTASTLLVIHMPRDDNPLVREETMTVRFAHDGLLLNHGDVVTTHWYFIRLL
jgi:hypothetical protein